eukprot:5950970-Amphidinium_carterae.1
MEATLEHLAWLLYPKVAHYTFTKAAYRIVKGTLTSNGMTLRNSHVLLNCLWLAVALIWPCLPILHARIALLVNIYSILVFGTDAQILKVKETEEDLASLPSFGLSMVALLALAWQSSNL